MCARARVCGGVVLTLTLSSFHLLIHRVVFTEVLSPPPPPPPPPALPRGGEGERGIQEGGRRGQGVPTSDAALSPSNGFCFQVGSDVSPFAAVPSS